MFALSSETKLSVPYRLSYIRFISQGERSLTFFGLVLFSGFHYLYESIGIIKHPHPGQVDVGLKFCHWNLNSIIARDKIKIPLIEAYNSIFHYDIIALSETIINNSVSDEDIFIEGFSKRNFS